MWTLLWVVVCFLVLSVGVAALAHRHQLRALRRDGRALERAVAGAPTVESAHELAALAARR
jgi:Tfp pilus assembly protein PilV